MMTMGKFQGRVLKQGADKLGRFTWTAYRGKKKGGVIVLIIYRPCKTPGENTTYMREWKALRESGDKLPDPRLSILEAAHLRYY